MQPGGWNYPRVPKKKFALPIEFWIFTFFSSFVLVHGFTSCHLQCNYSNLNVKFFQKITSSKMLEFWLKTLSTKQIRAHSTYKIEGGIWVTN
jgi:hypothetical protein